MMTTILQNIHKCIFYRKCPYFDLNLTEILLPKSSFNINDTQTLAQIMVIILQMFRDANTVKRLI